MLSIRIALKQFLVVASKNRTVGRGNAQPKKVSIVFYDAAVKKGKT